MPTTIAWSLTPDLGTALARPLVDPDFGVDVSTRGDLDPYFQPISGLRVVAEALVRRLTTPRGQLSNDPDFGTDVTAWVNESFLPQQVFAMEALLTAEVRKDERVEDARVKVTLIGEALHIAIEAQTAIGPFSLVLNVASAVTSAALGYVNA